MKQDKKLIIQYVADAQALYLQCLKNLKEIFDNHFVTDLSNENKLNMIQLYLITKRKITFSIIKAAVIKIYSQINKFSSFNVNNDAAKKKVSQNEVNRELLDFFNCLQVTANKQQQQITQKTEA